MIHASIDVNVTFSDVNMHMYAHCPYLCIFAPAMASGIVRRVISVVLEDEKLV